MDHSERILRCLGLYVVAEQQDSSAGAPAIFPVRDAVTSPDLFCIRFYGRNGSGWRSGKTSRQFDYCYTDDELCEWVEDRIGQLSRRTGRGILLFNNHVQAQAPQNALRMIRLLRRAGWPVESV